VEGTVRQLGIRWAESGQRAPELSLLVNAEPGETMIRLEHIEIGQEAICPDGLGRVIAVLDNFPHQWVQVSTYVNDRQCKWAPHNVLIIPLPRAVSIWDDNYHERQTS
jgi:hypothetical protein